MKKKRTQKQMSDDQISMWLSEVYKDHDPRGHHEILILGRRVLSNEYEVTSEEIWDWSAWITPEFFAKGEI